MKAACELDCKKEWERVMLRGEPRERRKRKGLPNRKLACKYLGFFFLILASAGLSLVPFLPEEAAGAHGQSC